MVLPSTGQRQKLGCRKGWGCGWVGVQGYEGVGVVQGWREMGGFL